MNAFYPTLPQAQPDILWVQGETGAKSYMVAPSHSVLLMDSESQRFYIKSTDNAGMPMPLRRFEYKEVFEETPLKTPLNIADDKYVTRDEYDALQGKIEALEKALKKPTPKKKEVEDE